MKAAKDTLRVRFDERLSVTRNDDHSPAVRALDLGVFPHVKGRHY